MLFTHAEATNSVEWITVWSLQSAICTCRCSLEDIATGKGGAAVTRSEARGLNMPFLRRGALQKGFKESKESVLKNIKVLGSGCKNCETTANLIRIAAEQAGVAIELEKITDVAQIMGYGVMSTPGVVVDGQVVHAGGLPGPDLIREWISR